jgi:gliding motility associated protien GldN
MEQLDAKLGKEDKMSQVEQEDGSFVEQMIPGQRRPEEVMRYQMKEVWFFDKQKARMDVRIVGLCPIRTYYRDDDVEQLNIMQKQVFWAYFPAIRPLLANHEVFNSFNDAERRTFDDIMMKRVFSSFVYQETNVYDNRRIDQYSLGLDAIVESERIKADIFKLEHDLWEY